MVETEVARDGTVQRARRFYLASLALTPAEAARAIRAHWGVENRCHWVMDVVYHDDLMRLRTGYGPENMARVKHMAMNLLHAAPGRESQKSRRKRAAWDDTYLKAVLTNRPK